VAMTRQQSFAFAYPGWDVSYDEDGGGDYLATRKIPINEYQSMNGAVERLVADDAGELFMLCDAQNHLAERLLTAQALGDQERERKRTETAQRIAQLPSRPGGPVGDVGSGPGPRLA